MLVLAVPGHSAAVTPTQRGGFRWRCQPAVSSLLAPALLAAGLDVLAGDSRDGLVRDQHDASVGIAARLLAGSRVLDARFDTHRAHRHRVLLRRRGDHATRDVPHTFAAAVDRDDDDTLFLTGALEGVEGARGGRLIHRIDEVDIG